MRHRGNGQRRNSKVLTAIVILLLLLICANLPALPAAAPAAPLEIEEYNIPANPATPLPGAAPLIVRGQPKTGLVGLSFDAGGQDGGQTALVLDELHRRGIQATFFLTGEWAEANPQLVLRMAAEGHELANHTYDHPHLPEIDEEEIVRQLARTEQAVLQISEVSLKPYVRPPFGAWDQRVLNVLSRHGYEAVYWTLDAYDWHPETSAQEVAKRAGDEAQAGDIVVFHCYPAKTAQALPAVLAAWQARGLRAGTVSQVLKGR